MTKQQTPFVPLCRQNRIFYAAPRTHSHGGNMLQQMRCGENRLHHITSGVETASVGGSALPSYAVMRQFRNLHTHTKKKNPKTAYP